MAFCPPAATAGGAAGPGGVFPPAFDVAAVVVAGVVEVAMALEFVAIASAAAVVVTGDTSVVAVAYVAVVPVPVADFAAPDPPKAAASIPLASINGYACEPLLECRERSDPRAGDSPTSLDGAAFGA